MDKGLASRILKKALKKDVLVDKVELIGSVYHSKGNKIVTKQGIFFIVFRDCFGLF